MSGCSDAGCRLLARGTARQCSRPAPRQFSFKAAVDIRRFRDIQRSGDAKRYHVLNIDTKLLDQDQYFVLQTDILTSSESNCGSTVRNKRICYVMLRRDRICGLKTEPKCSVSRPRPRPNARDLETKVLFSKPVWSRDLTSSVASHCLGLVLTDAVGLDTLRHHVVDASLGRRGGTDAASSGRRRTLLSTAVRTTPTRPIRAVRRRCGGVHQAGIIIRSIACSAWRLDADARARLSRISHSLFALPRLPAQSITHTHTHTPV